MAQVDPKLVPVGPVVPDLTPVGPITPVDSTDAPGFNLGKIKNAVGKGVTNVLDTTIGKQIKYGHEHGLQAFQNVMGFAQRPLQALEVGDNPLKALMHPNQEEPRLERRLREPISPGDLRGILSPLMPLRQIGASIGELERGPLSGTELPKKIARGVLDTGYDIINDPMTFVQPAKVATLADKLLLGGKGAKALQPLVAMAKASSVGKVLNPEAEIEGLTTYGKAALEAVVKKAEQATQQAQSVSDHVIAKAAETIRNGKIPDEVKVLFKNPKSLPAEGKGLTPQAVIQALRGEYEAAEKAAITRGLKESGITGYWGNLQQKSKDIFKNLSPEGIQEAQKGVDAFLQAQAQQHGGNWALKGLRYLTQKGNQAFLALPFPHGMNLTNLSYNRYGLGTTLKGIGNAARVSTGLGVKGTGLEKNIQELGELGANSQYRNIFNELGANKILGSAGIAKQVNKVVIPLERGSNWLQQKYLNPLETGLRSAALEAEKKAGVKGVEAARNIHGAFGSGPKNKITSAATQIGAPFMHFHAQTVPSSGWRTLVNNPGRITNLVKANLDMNKAINPGGPQFVPTVPGLGFARSVTDPIGYYKSIAGPLGELYGSYSALSLLEKGKVAAALSKALGRYIPLDQAGDVLGRIITNTRGDAGEKPTSDIAPIFTGGYFQKWKP